MRIPNTLTVIEAAVRLHTSQQRILSMIATGELPAINTSKGRMRPRWAIPEESIAALARPVQVAPVLQVRRHV